MITTSRLFDDKNLSVGDLVDMIVAENMQRFALGKIISIESSTFREAFVTVRDAEGNNAMYRHYYKHIIDPDEVVKTITLQLLEIDEQ